MFHSTTIQFLKDLKKNNNKEWFEKNRKNYDAAKIDFLNFVTSIINELQKKDTTLTGLDAKQCIFRINRDVRFSKNKSPYKTNMGASFNQGGKKAMTAGYYFHLEPEACFIAGGLWMPMPPELKKIRQEIDYNFNEFKNIVNNKNFKLLFKDLRRDKEYILSRPPKGYEENNLAIEYLKLKSFIISIKIEDEDLTNKNLIKKVISAFETMQPLIYFLNKAIEE
ncbi:MAG: DUF2461 domain-containing protein [Bacteroidetes bacterium]|nr:DUF2461 domain-containing protein [Bacteroidota bacterium]MBS1648413.1 DUF2461 domain-containing protein [Bacteroidota bacterium]